ncbi:MAG: hypothetical protein V9G20_31530 [Candidatus Promineifilaceae bacterium]
MALFLVLVQPAQQHAQSFVTISQWTIPLARHKLDDTVFKEFTMMISPTLIALLPSIIIINLIGVLVLIDKSLINVGAEIPVSMRSIKAATKPYQPTPKDCPNTAVFFIFGTRISRMNTAGFHHRTTENTTITL